MLLVHFGMLIWSARVRVAPNRVASIRYWLMVRFTLCLSCETGFLRDLFRFFFGLVFSVDLLRLQCRPVLLREIFDLFFESA